MRGSWEGGFSVERPKRPKERTWGVKHIQSLLVTDLGYNTEFSKTIVKKGLGSKYSTVV